MIFLRGEREGLVLRLTGPVGRRGFKPRLPGAYRDWEVSRPIDIQVRRTCCNLLIKITSSPMHGEGRALALLSAPALK